MGATTYENYDLAEVCDDVTRTCIDYRVTPPAERDYTPEEDAEADERAAMLTVANDRESARIRVKAIVDELQLEKARVQPVIDKSSAQITGADTKDVARAAKKIADAAIELARFVKEIA